jgi:hypothetical protein
LAFSPLFGFCFFAASFLAFQVLLFDVYRGSFVRSGEAEEEREEEKAAERSETQSRLRLQRVYARREKGPVTALSTVAGLLVTALGNKVSQPLYCLSASPSTVCQPALYCLSASPLLFVSQPLTFWLPLCLFFFPLLAPLLVTALSTVAGLLITALGNKISQLRQSLSFHPFSSVPPPFLLECFFVLSFAFSPAFFSPSLLSLYCLPFLCV